MSVSSKVPEKPQPRPALCSAGEVFGGVERHLLGLCTYLQRSGIRPILVLFHNRELADQARRIGVEPIILAAGHKYSLGTPRELASVFARKGVNLVHAHGYRAVVNCALANRHYQTRMVRTVHGRAEPRTRLTIPWFKEHVYRYLESKASRYMQATVCYVTDDLARTCAKENRDLRGRTIYNGIDPPPNKERIRPNDLLEAKSNLLLIGRISPVKGIGFAIRALAEPGVPDSVILNVIGSGPQQAELEKQAQDLGIPDRVRFLGFKHNVNDYLAYSDGLLMPSFHEGLPYVLLEAMAHGLPILASRVAGLAEVLHDEQTALLFTVGDVPGIGLAIRSLVQDQELANRLGAAARRDQINRFTLDHMGQEYWGVYQETLGLGSEHDEFSHADGTGK